ncbi:MAG: serine/threonine-protein kinase [Polyangiales bacterium]
MTPTAPDERARWTARSAPTLPPDHPPDATIRRSLDAALGGALDTLPRITLGGVGDAAGSSPEATSSLQVEALLGAGGMGRVYAATQTSLRRGVAVKVLAEVAPSHRAALLHEARITGRLEHPNIVPVHALGVDAQGDPVMVMKRIEGASLRALLQDASHPGWSPLDARHEDRVSAQVSVLLQVCDALSYAHAQGVVHRDVKPENVMVGPFGEVYLLDWGVALDLTAPQGDHAIVGTPAYMAPEMVDGDPARVSPRTDVFLLGATLHEVLAGSPPHRGATVLEVLRAAADPSRPTVPPDAPLELAALAARAMSPDPDLRPASAAAFREGLQAWSRHRASVALSTRQWEALRALQVAGEADEAALDRALACRHGFAQALKWWPENPDAQRGEGVALTFLADHAMARGDAAGARTFLDEIPGGDASRAEALAALERDLDASRARETRARTLQRELDLSGWLRGSPWVFAAMVGVTLLFAVGVTTLGRGGGDDEFVPLVVGDALMTLVIVAVIRAAHRAATENILGRRVAAVLVFSGLWVLTYDTFGWRLHWSVALTSAHKLLAIASLHVFSAALGLTALRSVGALALVCAALVTAFPARVYAITPASFVALTLALWFLARSGRLHSQDALR